MLKTILSLCLIACVHFYINAQSEVTLKHSYTFDSSWVADGVGDAHGTMFGGKISNGEYVAAEPGDYIQLPGDSIVINTYSGITLEALFWAPSGNQNFTMLSYFGGTVGNNGVNYLFQSAKNWSLTKTAISCLNTTEPWNFENEITTQPLEDGYYHHLVTTVDSTRLHLFVDGKHIGSTNLSPNNKIENLSNDLARLCRGGYVTDPTWLGKLMNSIFTMAHCKPIAS